MFVQGYYDRVRDKVLVSERLDNGKRILNEFAPIYEFYVEDSEYGEYTSIYGERCKKLTAHNKNEWFMLKKQYEGVKTFEKNFNIVNKVLYKNYKDAGVPKLHKSFIDIEVDRAGFEYLTVKELIEKACCPINAVSVYNDWEDKLYTFMLCPETLKWEEAREICGKFDNCILFESESELLPCLIGVLDDMDTLAGWNTNNFDYPYITRRIENILGQGQSAGLCLWGVEPKCMEKKGDFGERHLEYEFVGKWFADYLLLYKKHERGKKESYKLDSIAELELGENKVQHEESLEDMYRNRYEDFIRYNRQDTMLVKRLDDKLKYIDAHNVQAHDIPCTLEQTMGTVAAGDQSIINEAHNNNEIVPDKIDGVNPEFNGVVPPGAYCADPIIKGLVEWIFSFDMNSLYPTTIRTLNMSPETIIGQVELSITLPKLYQRMEEENIYKNKAERIPDWGELWGGLWAVDEYNEILNQTDTLLTLKFINGEKHTLTAKQIYNIIFNNNSNIGLSAFGTLFRTDKDGLIPNIFTKWYGQRKEFKKLMFKYESMLNGIKVEDENLLKELSNIQYQKIKDTKEYNVNKLQELVNNKDINYIKEFIKDNNLCIENGIILPKDKKQKNYLESMVNEYDLKQYIKKIQLNSMYGLLLNSSSTFYDFRLGASTTMSGRQVVKHLTAKANELLCGKYEAIGYCAQYNDTDSVYCYVKNEAFERTHPNFEFTFDNVKKLSDEVAEGINQSFPQKMKDIFHCTEKASELQKAAKEVVAGKGLFIAKKRYALGVLEHDGFIVGTDDNPEMKIMGIQVKRSDTPTIVRNLLKNMLKSLLTTGNTDNLQKILKDFKQTDWQNLKPWQKGTPKAVNKLTFYTNEYNKTGKCTVGHVMGAINWNNLIAMNNDRKSPKIKDGDKVIVCKMKDGNIYNMKSVAYPIDLNILPKWFKELPFDEQKMSGSVVDKTIESVFGVLGIDLSLDSIQEDMPEEIANFIQTY